MRTALTVLVIASAWTILSIPAACIVGRFIRFGMEGLEKPPQRRSRVPRYAAGLALMCLLLAACGGGHGSSDPPASVSAPTDPLPPVTTPPVTTPPVTTPPVTTPPVTTPPPPPACSQGTTLAPLSCACRGADLNADNGSCIVSAPPVTTLPPCAVGTSQPPLNCSCPANDMHADNSCTVPASTPAATMTLGYCPSTDYTAAGNACSSSGAALSSGQSAVLLWTSTNATGCYGSAGWPTSDELIPSGFVNTGVLTQSMSYSLTCQGGGGNATASVTVQVGTPTPPPGNPPPGNPPPASVPFAITIGTSAPSIVDSSGCPQDANGTPCQAILTVSDNIGGEAADVCTMNGTQQQNANQSWTVGPYPVDGPQVIAFACTSVFSQAATASITLTVVPPVRPQPDTFTEVPNGNGTYSLTWDTHSVQGAGGCYVEQIDNEGNSVTLSPGGAPAGSASSGYLSANPAVNPYTFTLVCSGAPDAGVPTFTVSL